MLNEEGSVKNVLDDWTLRKGPSSLLGISHVILSDCTLSAVDNMSVSKFRSVFRKMIATYPGNKARCGSHDEVVRRGIKRVN